MPANLSLNLGNSLTFKAPEAAMVAEKKPRPGPHTLESPELLRPSSEAFGGIGPGVFKGSVGT